MGNLIGKFLDEQVVITHDTLYYQSTIYQPYLLGINRKSIGERYHTAR